MGLLLLKEAIEELDEEEEDGSSSPPEGLFALRDLVTSLSICSLIDSLNDFISSSLSLMLSGLLSLLDSGVGGDEGL